ncbi:Transient receptor putative cation channel sub A member 1 [Madurella fahalii]|uniref:Transient receptor putative cation channel sub A member 1 n=1 Tax=Madurella fahalii TaxID=1157608 RepID=A0ABQ0G2C1_9PEZI
MAYKYLYRAVRTGRLRTVRRCIRRQNENKRIYRDIGDSKGRTPLILAARMGDEVIFKVVAALKRPPPNPDLQDSQGRTALIEAARRGYANMVNILINKLNADVDLADNERSTPVLWAARKNKWSVAKLLTDNQAAVDGPNNKQEIPLHFAIRTGNYNYVLEMLNADPGKASISVTDKMSRTPLHMAAEKGDIQIVRLLLLNGAFINKVATDMLGFTPYMSAMNRGYVAVAAMLY